MLRSPSISKGAEAGRLKSASVAAAAKRTRSSPSCNAPSSAGTLARAENAASARAASSRTLASSSLSRVMTLGSRAASPQSAAVAKATRCAAASLVVRRSISSSKSLSVSSNNAIDFTAANRGSRHPQHLSGNPPGRVCNTSIHYSACKPHLSRYRWPAHPARPESMQAVQPFIGNAFSGVHGHGYAGNLVGKGHDGLLLFRRGGNAQ